METLRIILLVFVGIISFFIGLTLRDLFSKIKYMIHKHREDNNDNFLIEQEARDLLKQQYPQTPKPSRDNKDMEERT